MKKFSISKVCSLLVMAISLIVLVSWQFYGDSFYGAFPNIPQTTPLTAILLLASSMALLMAAENQTREIAWLKVLGLCLVSFSLLIALWTGVQYLFQLRPSTEIVIFSKAVLRQSGKFPGRPSPRSVISSIVFGTTLFLALLNTSRNRQVINILVYVGAVIPWIVLFGYISLAQQFYSLSYEPATGMSPSTACCFLLIGIGIMGLSPDTGLIGLLKTSTSGGDLSRKFLPLVVIIPLLLSWWFNHNNTGQSIDIAKSWGLVSIFMIALILLGSSMIHKSDVAKDQLMTDLQNAEKKARKILESAPDSMVIVNGTGTIVMTNSQTEHLFGFSQSELLNKEVEILLPSKFRASHILHRQKYSEKPTVRRMGAGLELFGQHKDGHEFPVEISLSPIMMDDETLTCAAIRDVTDRKKKEHEILKLNKELEAFTYSVSHDLRAPLRSIHGYTEILEEDYSDKFDEEGKEVLNVVKRNATKMGTLIDDLLAFSRLGRQGLHKQKVDTNSMVLNIISEMKPNQNQPDCK